MPDSTPSRFDRALALSFAGSASNAPPVAKDLMENTNGKEAQGAVSRTATGVGAPEPSAVEHAASNGVLLRPADVCGVRHEERADRATGKKRQVVIVSFVASDESIDSHESILIADWDQEGRLKRYLSNPVVLWAHNREGICRPAIGHAENVRVEKKRLLLDVVCDDTTEFDREIAEKLAKGVLRAGSVGWLPGEAEIHRIDGCEVVVFSKNTLNEFTICNVGSNMNALSQRALIGTARDMARSAGGRVDMRSVVDQLRTAKTTAPPDNPTARAEFGAPKDTTMKTLSIDVRDVRANHTPAACPSCKEAMAVAFTNLPEPDSRALDEVAARAVAAEKALAEATTRATAAEGKAVETARALALANEERDAAKNRLAAMEPELTAARAENEKTRAALVAAAIDERVGKRVFPAERAFELRIADMLLADRTADPEKPGSTLGEKAFAARLAEIDARPDLGLLGGSLVNANAGQNTGAGANPEARNLAVEIDAILAKQTAPR